MACCVDHWNGPIQLRWWQVRCSHAEECKWTNPSLLCFDDPSLRRSIDRPSPSLQILCSDANRRSSRDRSLSSRTSPRDWVLLSMTPSAKRRRPKRRPSINKRRAKPSNSCPSMTSTRSVGRTWTLDGSRLPTDTVWPRPSMTGLVRRMRSRSPKLSRDPFLERSNLAIGLHNAISPCTSVAVAIKQ